MAVDGQHIYWAKRRQRSGARTSTARASIRSLSSARTSPTGWRSTASTSTGSTSATRHDRPRGPRQLERRSELHRHWRGSSGRGGGRRAAAGAAASIATPVGGATYWLGQAVASSFTCSDGAGGPGIASCLDQSGRASGAAIDTSTTGSHTFTVTATSTDGRTGTATETYTVAAPAPANPVLRELRESHLRWSEGSSLPHITSHAKHTPGRPAMGTTFSFTLNQPATVRLTFTQQVSDRVVSVKGHRECVAQTKRNHQRRKCMRTRDRRRPVAHRPQRHGQAWLCRSHHPHAQATVSAATRPRSRPRTPVGRARRPSRCGSRLSNSPNLALSCS